MLSLLIFLPVIAALILLLVPARVVAAFRTTSLFVAIAQIILSIILIQNFDTQITEYQLVEKASWISLTLGTWGNFNAFYWVGLDGMSLPLVVLSSVVML